MNRQKFKKMVLLAVDKIMAQDKQSIAGNDNRCAYRGVGGTCCPVGFMMDDESAIKADNVLNNGIKLVVKAGIWGEHLNGEQVHHLSLLQRAHDSAHGENVFRAKFVKSLSVDPRLDWVYDHLRMQAKENEFS
jgi:hypothetical protein